MNHDVNAKHLNKEKTMQKLTHFRALKQVLTFAFMDCMTSAHLSIDKSFQ